MLIGEFFEGEGVNAAHINVVLGRARRTRRNSMGYGTCHTERRPRTLRRRRPARHPGRSADPVREQGGDHPTRCTATSLGERLRRAWPKGSARPSRSRSSIGAMSMNSFSSPRCGSIPKRTTRTRSSPTIGSPCWRRCAMRWRTSDRRRLHRRGAIPLQPVLFACLISAAPSRQSTVLPEPNLQGPRPDQSGRVEAFDVLLVDRPTERAGVVLGLSTVLRARNRHDPFHHHPVEGHLAW